MGAAGFKGSWPPVFPDNGGMLINTKDLLLSKGTQIILNKGMQYFNFTITFLIIYTYIYIYIYIYIHIV